jgi:DMSO/TMAO reductase YedYZ heme-binding membrane subunit
MQRLFERPKVVYVGLVVAIVAFFALSAVGNTGTDAQNKASGVTWIGDIGWAMFLVSILATILYTVALVVRVLIRRRRRDVTA